MTLSKSVSIAFLAIVLLGIKSLSVQQTATEEAFTMAADNPALEWVSCPDFMPDSCRISVLHGNPAEPNADVFFKLEGNTSVPNHWHHSAERMVLVSGELKVDYEGQDPVVMTPGMYAYGPPELPHTASCESDAACVLYIAFDQPVDAFKME